MKMKEQEVSVSYLLHIFSLFLDLCKKVLEISWEEDFASKHFFLSKMRKNNLSVNFFFKLHKLITTKKLLAIESTNRHEV